MSTESNDDYLHATKHPWPCTLFLLPLLALYEGGAHWLGGGHASRTGADTWARESMQALGLPAVHLLPVLIVLGLIFWTYRRWGDRPKDVLGVLLGMSVEAVVFALLLWGLGRAQDPLLERVGIVLATPGPKGATHDHLTRAISYLGAGIYEEVLFRLLLYSLLLYALAKALPKYFVVVIAMVACALAFSAAHHVGSGAEPIVKKVFLFRAIAGAYFCCLFHFRGFGIAVGAHACYDVLVGSAMA